mmetsp:Transcript_86570/g.231221  ORF Transcript_86570/g.231221 Transcript_86570/m.231221 type:complete len:117 (+) Transcript_86570:26-376(+)
MQTLAHHELVIFQLLSNYIVENTLSILDSQRNVGIVIPINDPPVPDRTEEGSEINPMAYVVLRQDIAGMTDHFDKQLSLFNCEQNWTFMLDFRHRDIRRYRNNNGKKDNNACCVTL